MFFNRIKSRSSIHPVILFLIALLTFGPLIPRLGFYWDDWPIAWSLHIFGPSGFHAVFASDRPILAWTYLVTTTFLGESPIAWQVFGLFSRFLGAVAFWWLLRQVWPQRKHIAILASLIFLVFPGFSQQNISLIYSHYLFIQAVHLFSLGCMMRALRQPRRRLWWTFISMIGAIYSLFSLEYFLGLEFLRPLLIYWSLNKGAGNNWLKLKSTFRYWVPFIPILPLYIIWRTQVVGFMTYQPSLLDKWATQPIGYSVEVLIRLISQDLFKVVVGSWTRIFPLRGPESFGLDLLGLYVVVVALIFLGVALYLYLQPSELDEKKKGSGLRIRSNMEVLITGVWALATAGWPFWISELPITQDFPNDRFVLSFMVGASLVVAALVLGIGIVKRTRFFVVSLIALMIGLGSGQQILYATDFLRERYSDQPIMAIYMEGARPPTRYNNFSEQASI